MTRYRSRYRRAAAVVVAALVGLAGAVALAPPAGAEAEQAGVSGSCAWDPDAREWVVTWTVAGPDGEPFRVDSVTATPESAPVDGISPTDGDGLPHDTDLTGVQRVPEDADTASLSLDLTWDGDRATGVGAELSLPTDCDTPEPPAQVGAWTADCDAITITIDNSDEDTVALTFAPSAGDPVDVEVAGGESATVQFVAAPGLTVDVRYEAWSLVDPDQPIEITPERWAELGCDDNSGDNSDEGDEGLPATGTPVLLIAAGALALVGLGAGLFLLARRRRIRFTA